MFAIPKFNLKHLTVLFVLLFAGLALQAQKVSDFKTKNSTNTAERTAMLDLLRAEMKTEYKMEFKFVVDHFKVSGNWAWLKATAQRKDGKQIELDENTDCCHVETLFKKENGKWKISQYAAFSTDLWYENIQSESGAPQAIFD